MRSVESIGALRVGQSVEQVQNELVNSVVVENISASKESIILSLSDQVRKYMNQHIAIDSESVRFMSDNVMDASIGRGQQIRSIVNVQQINNVRYINKYLIKVNKALPDAGIYVGCVESTSNRKRNLFKRKTQFLCHLIWLFNFIIHRVWPKVPSLRKLYFFITKGKYRWLTIAEVLGRVVSCGFEIIEFKEIEGKVYFVIMKTSEVFSIKQPSYAPVFAMQRVGKHGKMIKVYKIRTMHPYSEYLQDYVIRLNGYNAQGKPANDFRLTRWGQFFRKYWFDELPQIINVLKGNMNIVGVRPLSQTRFNELPEDVQKKRILFKPGCIPPYVALNMPDNEQNIEAERIYMNEKHRSPILTDFRYFFKALYNILSGRISSS
ncbi:sugar transferase [Carboxylicivirga sp. M1479]|uniref:sugar transferase n=1 Tax=Carboxylicivirga sp. M1479 TaxID=2594476 RepID=UPI00117887DD|nr:sugar transferase [Carboxylicivirga sp. M1479]TRX66341.1 sugar transferase [Carboxylicivirga sp. M1479]